MVKQAQRGTVICLLSHSLKVVAAMWTHVYPKQSLGFLHSRPPHVDWLLGGRTIKLKFIWWRPGGNHDGAATECRVQKVLEIRPCIRFAIWMTSSTEQVNAEVLFFPFNGSRQLRLRDHDLLRSQENQQLSCVNSKSTNWSPGLSVPSLRLLIILSPVKVLCLSEQERHLLRWKGKRTPL